MDPHGRAFIAKLVAVCGACGVLLGVGFGALAFSGGGKNFLGNAGDAFKRTWRDASGSDSYKLVAEMNLRDGGVEEFLNEGAGSAPQKKTAFVIQKTEPKKIVSAEKSTSATPAAEILEEVEESAGEPQKISYPKLLINEIQIAGENASEEFVELFNPNDTEVKLSGWYIQKKTKNGTNWSSFAARAKFEGLSIKPKSFLVIAHPASGIEHNLETDAGIAANNSLLLKNPNREAVDKAGWGEAGDCEKICAVPPSAGESIQRKPNGNIFADFDNNSDDFELMKCPSPGAAGANCVSAVNNFADAAPPPVIESANPPPEISENTSQTNKILISEIFYDAEGSDSGKEFVELYNLSQTSVDISGWKLLRDGSSIVTIKDGDRMIIPAAGYFLIGFSNYTGTPAGDAIRSATLPNTAASISLINKTGEIVDKATYNNSVVSGQSWERISWDAIDFRAVNPSPRNSGF